MLITMLASNAFVSSFNSHHNLQSLTCVCVKLLTTALPIVPPPSFQYICKAIPLLYFTSPPPSHFTLPQPFQFHATPFPPHPLPRSTASVSILRAKYRAAHSPFPFWYFTSQPATLLHCDQSAAAQARDVKERGWLVACRSVCASTTSALAASLSLLYKHAQYTQRILKQ